MRKLTSDSENTPADGKLDALRRRIEQAKRAGSHSGTIPRRSSVAPSPLSFAQQRIWFLDRLEMGDNAYNTLKAVSIRGRLDLSALERAIDEIIRRHESLRTSFPDADGQPEQVIAQHETFRLPLIDLSALPEPDRTKRTQQFALAERRRAFDLARGPLIFVTLLRMNEAEHVLMISVHHIISDAWSTVILMREMQVLYKAFSAGEESPLRELPIQYADFANWQRGYLRGDKLEEQLNYWRRQLEGAAPVLELPTDKPRSTAVKSPNAKRMVPLPAETLDALRVLARQENATLFMILLTAFMVLLHRYTEQDDIVTGVPIANRNRTELEGLIGFFVNQLVLRGDLGGEPSFRELLNRIRKIALDAYAHQDLPFEKLVEELNPERNLNRQPLFQVVFTFQNRPAKTIDIPGLTMDWFELLPDIAKYDLLLYSEEREEGELAILLQYNRDLYEDATIDLMASNFGRLLESITKNPNTVIGELEMIGAREKKQVLEEWNGSSQIRCSDAMIHELFEQQVARAPEAVAIVCEGQSTTYGELNSSANQLANYLAREGAAPERLIGVCLDRSVDLIVSLLAVLKTGAGYVPLDPDYPRQRLAFILEDAGVSLLITNAQLADRLPQSHIRQVFLDRQHDEISREYDQNRPQAAFRENAAYVIHTSGSTGAPKGVWINRSSIARLLEVTKQLFQMNQHDVWTMFHSYAFDFSVWEIFGALCSGARLVIVPYWASRSPERLHEILCEHRVTILSQTPSAFYQLIDSDSFTKKDGLCLRYVFFGGEALDFKRLKPWIDGHGDNDPRLINMFGITETTVHATHYRIRKSDVTGAVRGFIGRPLPDWQVYILDNRMHLAPVGVRGEIHVGGAGLARGYLNRPELTAERFIPNPFGKRSGDRLYKSGDLARYRPDGVMEYFGRSDQQVKVRGYRIELGEIEAALRTHKFVKEAVVVATEENQEKRLVAYVVSEEQANTGGIRESLKTKLPAYMIPSIVRLDNIPLTVNGKVDTASLPAPQSIETEKAGPYLPPSTPMEQMLAEVWEEVLGVKRIGIRDNFFELGGHSLNATQVVSRVMKRSGVVIPLRTLMEKPTIEALSSDIIEEISRDTTIREEILGQLESESASESIMTTGVVNRPN